jgi:pyruvate kinase
MRRTKTICTIGPSSESKTKINLLIKNGMNIARLNFSHGTHAWFANTINNIRSEAKKANAPIAILQDLCGPKIRLGKFPIGGLEIKHGQKITIAYKPDQELKAKKDLCDCNLDLTHYLKKGQIILIDDGKAQLEVLSINKKNKSVTFSSQSNHFLKNNKGINLPNTPTDISSLTTKDINDLIFGLKFDIEYIALSFVKTAKDITKLQKILQKHKVKSKIIAKIETALALENIDEIIQVSDGIMVARGDLGLETPIEELATVQKMIIQKCINANKPVIVATQMLASMTNNPIPTRAEATDVANAVFDHVDAVMLSEETAAGNFPIKSINTLSKICEHTDQHCYTPANGFLHIERHDQITAIAHSACHTAIDMKAKFIIVPSSTGQSARIIASHRPPVPIIACTNEPTLYNQLNLIWGTTPFLTKSNKNYEMIPQVIKHLINTKQLAKGDKIIIVISSNLTHLEADQMHIKTI